jgi:hypothetical protein
MKKRGHDDTRAPLTTLAADQPASHDYGIKVSTALSGAIAAKAPLLCVRLARCLYT